MLFYKYFDYDKFYKVARKSTSTMKVSTKNEETEEKEINEVKYSNLIFSFDTETTSYYITPEEEIIMFSNVLSKDYLEKCIKQSLMYIWMFNINGTVVYGRNISDLKDFFKKFTKGFKENNTNAIIYVHNLGFDFTSIYNTLGEPSFIFAREKRRPMKIVYENWNIEFRDSLALTNKGLEAAGKDLGTEHQKQTGKLDYNVLRTPNTKLTEDEMLYCEFDVIVLNEIIEKYKEKFKNTIYRIPLTQTGIVRRKLHSTMYKHKSYRQMIKDASPSYKDYQILCQAYMGGYTHANYLHVDKVLKNIVSFDFASSYPSVLCTEKYPITNFFKTDKKLKDINTEEYAYIVDVVLLNVKAKNSNSFISASKAILNTDEKLVDLKLDNGRIREVKAIHLILTDQDFKTVVLNYDFYYTILNLYIAKKDYLHRDLIELILKDYYAPKTQLKGIKEKETLYNEIKQLLNAIYGMCCTKEQIDTIVFENGIWESKPKTIEEISEHFEKVRERGMTDLLFSWGVWCSAYARRNLWEIIEQIGDDVVYCDTDSIKFIETKENLEKINKYNERHFNKIKLSVLYNNIDPKYFMPTDIKGIQRPIGFFENDGYYEEFKTLGAKKYAYIKKGKKEIEITVSGLKKECGKYIKDLETDFYDGRVFTTEETEKNVVLYIDNQQPVKFKDGWYENCKLGVHLEPTTFVIGLSDDFKEFLYEMSIAEE